MKKIIPVDSVLIPDQAKRVFEGMIFDVYQWEQELFDSSMHTFEMLKRTDTVSVIAIVDGKVMVIDDEQPHLGSRRSFPGGRVDDTDDDILSAAKREVLEETGYTFENWRLVKVWQPYRKMEWFVHVLLAWDVAGSQEPKPDPGEKIKVELLEFDEVKREVMGKQGYLGESQDIFQSLAVINDLVNLPEFNGHSVDR